MTRHTAAAIALILTTPSACVVSTNPFHTAPPTKDDRILVRVATTAPNSATEQRDEGLLIWIEPDSLRIYSKEHRTSRSYAAESIAALAIYRGQRGSAKGAAEGAGKGALVGAVVGSLVGAAAEATFGGWDGEREIGEAAAEGAAIGAVEGAVIGGVAGAIAGEAVWQPISYRELREETCRCRVQGPDGA